MTARNDRTSAIVREVLELEGGITVTGGVATLTGAQLDDPDIDGGTIEDVAVSGTLEDSTTFIVDNADPTKKMSFELAGISTGETSVITVPDADMTLASTDTTQTFTGVKTLTTPVLGVATATSINKVAITAPATGATLTIPDGVTLTGPAASGTVATLAGAETLTNKTLTAPVMTTPTLGVATATSINKVAITAPATGATLTIPDNAVLTAPAGTATLASLADVDISEVPNAAGSRQSLLVLKINLTDNVTADAVVFTIPNGIHGGTARILAVGTLGDGDSTHTQEYFCAFSRITGAAAKAVLSAAVGSVKTTGAGADATLTAALGAVGGAVGDPNTFALNVKVARSAGASDNHTAVLYVELLNCNSVGMTMAAA